MPSGFLRCACAFNSSDDLLKIEQVKFFRAIKASDRADFFRADQRTQSLQNWSDRNPQVFRGF